ncbi:MAG: DUF4407 domain-containing protein [Parapedobacter sp.]|nr:MAG: DUF4407 domain-containing protein [Parapedobacter sp.]
MEKESAYLRFCCFLTGLSYPLTRISSEQSAKNAKKYMGALLIIMLVWFFIGYCFATRYLHMGIAGGVVGGMLMSFIILQIERIIILSHHISMGGKVFRIILGLVMAILGAMIMDQFTFQDDINKQKKLGLESQVKEAIKEREREIRFQLSEVDTVLFQANARLLAVSEELRKTPVIVSKRPKTTTERDSMNRIKTTVTSIETVVSENPLQGDFDFLKKQIDDFNTKKNKLTESLVELEEKTRIELAQLTGFLDELILLKEVIASNWVGMFVYALFLFFFLSLELFILIMKLSDKESDYDKLVDHQMDVRIQMLQRLKA